MSKSRLPLVLGLGAAGGVGYYFYAAGGNAKAAENKFESDVHRASAKVKANLPNSEDNTARSAGQQAGAKFDNAVSEADRQAGRVKSNAEAYAKDAKAEALKAVDKFDHKVEEGTSKAKGWFGGSK
jgi:hypothetical protein